MSLVFPLLLVLVLIVAVRYQQKKQTAAAAENVAAGQAFLVKNAERPEVTVLPSGLQYEVLQEGDGAQPNASSKVTTHYQGSLINGTIFDSSIKRGKPATFGVGQVIKGWQEGLPLMSVGAIYKFYIPQDLAYGMRAPSPMIPAGSALIFEVKLLAIA